MRAKTRGYKSRRYWRLRLQAPTARKVSSLVATYHPVPSQNLPGNGRLSILLYRSMHSSALPESFPWIAEMQNSDCDTPTYYYAVRIFARAVRRRCGDSVNGNGGTISRLPRFRCYCCSLYFYNGAKSTLSVCDRSSAYGIVRLSGGKPTQCGCSYQVGDCHWDSLVSGPGRPGKRRHRFGAVGALFDEGRGCTVQRSRDHPMPDRSSRLLIV